MKSIYRIDLHRTRVALGEPSMTPYGMALRSSRDVARIFRAFMEHEPVEIMLGLLIDVRGKLVGIHEIARGNVATCAVEPSSVYRAAIVATASAIIVAHNHPSGESAPSDGDVVLTERIKKAGDILGIELLDHLIIGEGESYFSFSDAGLLRRGGQS